MAMEIRSNLLSVAARAADGTSAKSDVIEGYAAVFNEPTVIWDFEEVIAPGAFKRALSENQDVRALFNHDSNYPLARTKNGTLVMREDARGLWTESRVSSNPTSDSVVDYIRTGLVTGMSFAFTVRKNEWVFQPPGSEVMDKRIITEVGILYDIGPVTYPAYDQTSVKMRAESKKLHDEARSRWESRRSSFQVPVGVEDIFRECRSGGEVWEVEPSAEEVKLTEEAKKDEKAIEGSEGQTVQIEQPAEAPQPEAKAPEIVAAQAPAEEPKSDLPEGKDGLDRAHVEAIDREIALKRARAKLR